MLMYGGLATVTVTSEYPDVNVQLGMVGTVFVASVALSLESAWS
jgi:hypothetical protein